MRGDALRCSSKGAYLFGAPMPGADAETNVTRQRAFFEVPDLDLAPIGNCSISATHTLTV